MTARAGARLLALPPSAIVDRPAATLADVDRTLEPDAVWVLGPSREPQAFAAARRAFDAPVFHPPLETGDGAVHRREVDDRDVAVVQSVRAMRASPDDISSALESADDGTALVCDNVATSTRPTALETTLEGADALAAALPTGRVTTVLTGGEPAGYDELWNLEVDGTVRSVDHDPAINCEPAGDDCVSVRVQGVGDTEGYGGEQSVALLEFTADGIGVDTYDVTDFGLESVSGIGPKTAGRLAERGVTTRAELLETPVETLAELPNVGWDRARRMHHHATVLETGEPRRVTDESLPGENWSTPPLCVDIETDGLSPTIIWQIGVYDPAADTYQAFVERDDPNDPASVLEAFCDWLLGVHPNRALLTWNGWHFDYRHLDAFVAKHVPYYAEEWDSIPKLDLYLWAVRNENAILPGRTNKLESVAGALGYEDAGTGLDGAQTAAAYQRFMRTGEPLEWDRHEAYCEDDCRALWHVYERLQDAPRVSDSGATTGSNSGTAEASSSESISTQSDTSETSTADSEQTGLGDF
ncbi:ribonuclease H-like domain-containing protein [Halopiger aswanensis]|uniref:Putative RecB family nuclease n=1 Tax=Halopiger aswanensis TaxID=148449 RepID=A0A419WP66_9EURY|nr:ribonuclease H-like domain-containing protein [Halopiger aswanensis]RKD97301.1 putative RecB family nuclease [Halopiger aswanensis]